MTNWTAITKTELQEKINESEKALSDEPLIFWQLIRVNPIKWSEKEYGVEGDGFWVVGILGTKVVWYNDIEEGFNFSSYITYGQIDDYSANQYELNELIIQILDLMKLGTLRDGNQQ